MQKKDKEVVIPFWGGVIFPLEIIAKRFKDFFLLVSGFSFLSAIISMVFGRSFACGLDDELFFCGNNVWNSFIVLVVAFVFSVMFIRCWWFLGFKEKSLSEVLKMKAGVMDLKIAGFLLGGLCFLGVLGGGVYVLLSREATPQFDFELAWFVFVSLFIIVALFVLLNAVVFIRFLDGKKWLVFHETGWPIFDNVYKLMGWFLFYLLFILYFIRQVGRLFIFCRQILPMVVASFIADFALYFVFYLAIACVISLLKYQEKCIFANEED